MRWLDKLIRELGEEKESERKLQLLIGDDGEKVLVTVLIRLCKS